MPAYKYAFARAYDSQSLAPTIGVRYESEEALQEFLVDEDLMEVVFDGGKYEPEIYFHCMKVAVFLGGGRSFPRMESITGIRSLSYH